MTKGCSLSKLIVNAHYYRGSIFFDDNELVERYKMHLAENEELTVTFEPRREYRSDRAANLFNACYDRWAKEQGIERGYARNLMKWRHGVKELLDVLNLRESLQSIADKPGDFFEHEQDIYFLLSTNAYTKEQMHNLIEGTLRDMDEAQIDTNDLRQEWVASAKP